MKNELGPLLGEGTQENLSFQQRCPLSPWKQLRGEKKPQGGRRSEERKETGLCVGHLIGCSGLWESMGGTVVPGAVLVLGQEHGAAGRCCLLRSSLQRAWLCGSLDIDFHVPLAFVSARRQKSSVGSGSMPVTASAERQPLPVSPQGSSLPFQGQEERHPAHHHAGDNGWVSLRTAAF